MKTTPVPRYRKLGLPIFYHDQNQIFGTYHQLAITFKTSLTRLQRCQIRNYQNTTMSTDIGQSVYHEKGKRASALFQGAEQSKTSRMMHMIHISTLRHRDQFSVGNI